MNRKIYMRDRIGYMTIYPMQLYPMHVDDFVQWSVHKLSVAIRLLRFNTLKRKQII